MHKTPVSSWLGKLGSPTELQMLDHASGGTCIWCKILAYTSRAKLGEKDFESHNIASTPIGAWEVNFPPLYEIMTDLSTDQLGQREVSSPLSKKNMTYIWKGI